MDLSIDFFLVFIIDTQICNVKLPVTSNSFLFIADSDKLLYETHENWRSRH